MELASHGHAVYSTQHGPHRQAQHLQPQVESGMELAVDDTTTTISSLLYSNNGNFHNLPQHEEQQPSSSRPHSLPPPQRSPNTNNPMYMSRSSPIAIIHNPEDGADQAKLRWQHPMYDTSDDDEMDNDDDYNQTQGVSVQSLTSPPPLRANNMAPKSLPNSLLRAPKLGSLPAQDYLLHHLATLPPPMCLNGAMAGDGDVVEGQICGSPPQQTTASSHHTTISGSYKPAKPKYLSSYGSLRESHLTGRFGGPASRPQIYNNSNAYADQQSPAAVRFEPPATLIPPRQPQSNLMPPRHSSQNKPVVTTNNNSTTEPQQQQEQPSQPSSVTASPKNNPPLSIRDRMMQKAQQKEKQDQEAAAATQKAASSLSAMLEASEKDNPNPTTTTTTTEYQIPLNDQQQGTEDASGMFHLGLATANAAPGPALHRSSLGPGVLPAGISQAVAISYNSNMTLFSRNNTNNNNQQQEQESSSSAMLSSSMTGLEILRGLSKSRPTRPTSLSILQDASRRGSLQQLAPPPASTHAATTATTTQSFQPLARTMSEPSPHHWNDEHYNNHRQSTSASSTPPQVQSSSQQEVSTRYSQSGILHTSDGRTLIPPRQMAEEQAFAQRSYPQQQQHPTEGTTPSNLQYSLNAWDASMRATPTVMTSAFGGHAYQGATPPFATHPPGEEENPDTEGAFDMDLE